jgi:hypothetical protein
MTTARAAAGLEYRIATWVCIRWAVRSSSNATPACCDERLSHALPTTLDIHVSHCAVPSLPSLQPSSMASSPLPACRGRRVTLSRSDGHGLSTRCTLRFYVATPYVAWSARTLAGDRRLVCAWSALGADRLVRRSSVVVGRRSLVRLQPKAATSCRADALVAAPIALPRTPPAAPGALPPYVSRPVLGTEGHAGLGAAAYGRIRLPRPSQRCES